MIYYFGKRLYGKINKVGSTFVATLFFHIQFLPLFPLESHLFLNDNEALPLPLQWRSVIAGYARVWGPLALLAVSISTLVNLENEPDDLVALARLAVLFAVLAAVISSWLWLGRPSFDELAQRVVYEKRCGHPIDVAHFHGGREQIEGTLRPELMERAPSLRSATYRDAPAPATDWRAVAIDPSVTDRAYLEDALTLLRIEATSARGPDREAVLADHARTWNTLKQVAPDILEQARAYRPAAWKALVLAAIPVAVMVSVSGSLLAERVALGNGRLSELLSRDGPKIEQDLERRLYMGRPVLADSKLQPGDEVLVLLRVSPFAALKWYLADVVSVRPDGHVEVILQRNPELYVVPRDALRREE